VVLGIHLRTSGKGSTTYTIILLLVSFSDRVSCFLPGPASGCEPPTSASHVAGITSVNYHTGLICWDRVLLIFLPHCS
jgi:hypothetical protein